MLINSLLQNDFYKFTMAQAVLHNFPATEVEYAFKWRGDNNYLEPSYIERIKEEVHNLCSLTFQPEELEYLGKIPFLKSDFIDFLENYRLREKHIKIESNNGVISIRVNGSWINTIFFEVPVLAIVNGIRSQYEMDKTGMTLTDTYSTGFTRLYEKIALVKKYEKDFLYRPKFLFADFGLRRCFSPEWQDDVIAELKNKLPTNLTGTSNIYLAKKHGIKYIGTMAHEWLMAGQAMPNVRVSESQKYMLEAWVKEYRGDLGIALSDTLGFQAFLSDFDKFLAKLYDGCRQDSGDPIWWGNRLIEHYNKLNIDPRTKSAVFSDSLTFKKALDLLMLFGNDLKVSFGIGTNLTNDCGIDPINIVMKLVKVNGLPVAKISDSPGKCMCEDEEFTTYLKSIISGNSYIPGRCPRM